jgi:hypothetical protein
MKLDLHIPTKCPFWTKIWLKKGQNTPKSVGTPLAFLSYRGLLLGRFLPKRCLFWAKFPPKRGHLLQEIGHFWPFYRAILLGLGSTFLLFSKNTLNLRCFLMKLNLYIPIKSPFWTKTLLKKGQNAPKRKGTPLAFLSYEEPYLGTFSGKLAQKGFILAWIPPLVGSNSLPPLL